MIFEISPNSPLAEFISGISGTCEATLFEVYTIHGKLQKNMKVVQELSGFGHRVSVSNVDGVECYQYLSFSKLKFDDHWVLFWEPTSSFVDHFAIEEWFKINIPDLPSSDPMNFYNLIHAMKRNAENVE